MDNTTHESLTSGLCSAFYTPPAAWGTEGLGVYEQMEEWGVGWSGGFEGRYAFLNVRDMLKINILNFSMMKAKDFRDTTKNIWKLSRKTTTERDKQNQCLGRIESFGMAVAGAL